MMDRNKQWFYHLSYKPLNISRTWEILPLQTVHQDVKQLEGLAVSFEVSPLSKPAERYQISDTFSANGLSLEPSRA